MADKINAAPTPSKTDHPNSSTGRLGEIEVTNDPHP
jgi:hypothetical protein